MRQHALLLVLLLTAAAPAAARVEDPLPGGDPFGPGGDPFGPGGDPFGRAVGLLSEDEAPPPAVAPKKEDPPKPAATSPEVLALLRKAAEAQGTASFVGEKAVRRFLAIFDPVLVFSVKGDKVQTKSTEAFALPPAGQTEARLRSDWKQDGKVIFLGHDGRTGWMKVDKKPAWRFQDALGKDRQDVADLEHRRRMLRLALRVFFIGNLAEGPVVTLAPGEEIRIPVGNGAKPRLVPCRVLDRAADPEAGEPPIRIYLHAKTLLPVATVLFGPGGEGASTLLTFDYDEEGAKEARDIPDGVKVPLWCELFELPAEKGEAPIIRIQAGVQKLTVEPVNVPDTLFAFPR